MVVDSNLLVLQVVGGANIDFIAMNKNTEHYSVADFEMLGQITGDFAQIVVTPGTLAETSNLARQMKETARSQVMSRLQVLINEYTEIHMESLTAASRSEFGRLGLVDTSLLALCLTDPESLTLLTHDGKLAAAAQALDLSVEYFQGWR